VTEPPPQSWGNAPPPQSWGTAPPPPPPPGWSQPPAGPVPYGTGPYGPPPSPGRSKLPWIIGAAAVVLVGAVVAAVLLVRAAGGEANTPESAATSFIQAAKDGDCEAYTAVTSDNFQDTYGRCESDVDTTAVLGGGVLTIDDEVSITDETDDTATAEVDVSAAGFTVPLELQLVREGEVWLVDDMTVAGFGLDDVPSFEPGPPSG